jgi:pyruvate ferredoxin oxidoreductase alpha subunit
MRKVLEGSIAVAEAVKACRPHVISAYPITPQTHIVEGLAKMVADGELKAEFVNVESEFAAASVVLGASAAGARVYSATTSQGLLLMNEVLYNIAGMRLPVVICGVNRAVSAPLNIWNDQQDTISVRDAGWIQLYAENNQDVMDLHIQAYRIAEDHRVLLPVLVCMDGFVLTHTFEPVEIPDQEKVDKFLPPYKPLYKLTPQEPLTFGMYAGPDCYMEFRYMLQEAMERAAGVIEEVAEEFAQIFGRYSGGLIEEYYTEDAETVIISLGSVVETIKEVVDKQRAAGKKVGCLKIRAYRPFPADRIRQALRNAKRIAVVEKCISIGALPPVATDVRAAFQSVSGGPEISAFVAGLGGRDIPSESIEKIIEQVESGQKDLTFVDLRKELLEEEVTA